MLTEVSSSYIRCFWRNTATAWHSLTGCMGLGGWQDMKVGEAAVLGPPTWRSPLLNAQL
jgi:hypothetical protein